MPKAGEEDVDAVRAAEKGVRKTWRDKTPKDRMELLLKLADVIDENAEELARLESLNVGSLGGSPSTSPASCRRHRFFAGAARNLEGKAATEYVEGYVDDPPRATRHRGRDAAVGYPLFMVMWKMGPALAAGNVQIIKPAEQTPLTVLRFVGSRRSSCRRASSRSSPARGSHGRPARATSLGRLVSLTGDTAAEKLIAKNAADTEARPPRARRRAPMVVLDDADPATVAEAIKVGGYFNSGQDCNRHGSSSTASTTTSSPRR